MSALKDQNSSSPFTGPVASEWLSRGIWLSQAWKKIPNEYLDAAREAATEFAALHGCDSLHLEYAEAQTGNGFGEYREHRSQLTGEERRAWTKYANHRAMAEMAVLNSMVGFYHGGMPPLVAFGSPDRAGAEFRWISPFAWKQMTPAAGEKDIVSGGGNIYYDVHVVDFNRWLIEAVVEEDEITPKLPSRIEPWDEYQAQVFLSAEKVSGRHGDRPNEKTLVQLLVQKFDAVPRDPMRTVARKVWPHAQPGVRKGTKRPPKPRN